MNWNQLLSPVRLGQEELHNENHDNRNEFQRDYDRLIFSSPFRRLQNKTQVFPLPKSIFVHNRLTHSLEVASVGRSLGVNVSRELSTGTSDFINEIGSIVSAACLAHDLGNPPFGHSGEKAIATFFSEGRGHFLKDKIKDEVAWDDCIRFEGNANAFRLLTHQFNGRRKGGFVLTYSTLASIVKYPYSSIYADDKKQKFGFFESERTDFEKITARLGIPKLRNNSNRYARYPLVYLVEAADDICYQIMDIEDAHKLKILTTEETKSLLLNYFDESRKKRIEDTLLLVSDVNEQIAYLRSSVIGELVKECSDIFVKNEERILAGEMEGSLIKNISEKSRQAYKQCSNTAVEKIYKSQEVLDIELAGYKIILTLLEHFIDAVLYPEKSYSQQLLNRIPAQYETNNPSEYGKTMAILDYISGMTDVYALDLYRKIMGMEV
ncbi:MAG: deoxyguanosinetriphosphate triphosphohydrolase [Paludibacteraceae bacterium]